MAPKPPKINCDRTYKLYANKVGITLSILDKIKVGFNIEPTKMASLNDWTSWALARVFTECDLYQASDRGPAAQKRYTDELDKLDDWVQEMAEILGKWGALVAKTADADKSKKKTDDDSAKDKKDKDKAKSDVEKSIDKHVDKGKSTHPTQLKKSNLKGKDAATLLSDLKELSSQKATF